MSDSVLLLASFVISCELATLGRFDVCTPEVNAPATSTSIFLLNEFAVTFILSVAVIFALSTSALTVFSLEETSTDPPTDTPVPEFIAFVPKIVIFNTPSFESLSAFLSSSCVTGF